MEKHANSVDKLLLGECFSQTWSLTATSEYRRAILATDEVLNPHSTDGNDCFPRYLEPLIQSESLVQNKNAMKRNPP
jgi:hypothetical protein